MRLCLLLPRRAVRVVVACLLGGACLAGAGSARGDESGDGEGEGASAPAVIVDLSEMVASARARHGVPALGGAVVRGSRGGVVALGVDGVRAVGSEEKVQVDDRWHLGSCTKSMTATVIARLAERHEIRFTDPLGELFPEIEVCDELAGVSLERLVAHRAGFPANYPRPLWSWLYRGEVDPRAQRKRIAEEMLVRPPPHPLGGFVYSNMGFDLAGAALELRADMSFEDLMRRELFLPLRMTTAGFGPPGSAERVDQPRGHRVVGEQVLPVPPGPAADNPPSLSPAGRACMSLRDWGKYIALHLGAVTQVAGETEGETKPFLEPKTVKALHRVADGESYAHGWAHHARAWAGGDCLMHAGSNTMWYAVCWVAPKRDFAVLAVTNVQGQIGPRATNALIDDLIRWHLENAAIGAGR